MGRIWGEIRKGNYNWTILYGKFSIKKRKFQKKQKLNKSFKK